jgi:hypothetical protein
LALTTDYGVMGYLAPADTPLVGFLNVATQLTFSLTAAQIQSLQPYGPANSDRIPEVVLPKAALLGVIPQDDAGRRSAAQQMAGQSLSAMVFLGPFVIKAQVPVVGNMPLRNAFAGGAGDMMALANVEVRCQIPNTRFPELKAPIMVVNKRLTQFFHPA